MTWDEFDAWSEHSVRGFASQQVAAGLQAEADAAAYAREQFAQLLPSGLATPLHLQWTVHEVLDDGADDVVGWLWLRVRTLSTEVEAYLFDVELVEPARGRGLGRATVLAAEQAARDLGAEVMRLNVFGHNTAARRLYTGLGYVVTSAQMSKRLDDLPAGSPRVELREMTEDEFARFRPRLEAEYGANIARSGSLPPVEAARKAASDLDHLLPQGPATPGHLLRTALVDGEPVGEVWLQLRERSDGVHAFGYDLRIRDELRGHGHGRAVVAAAEQLCREHGARTVGLSVFGFNDVARRLYESAGFELTAQLMAKPL